MTSPFKLVDKIDDFAVELSITDIASLTKGLIQLQHARYPHLVPMYRTVHRTKPRNLVLRAIRWVNPKRMFPGAGLTRKEMDDMSSQELSDLIVKLNEYRGEAHVIHNRYNQMIDLINMGELPYFIPYAGFKQDKWSMLQEYMDRAERLKDGTKEWENVLDHQALEIRNILLNREGDDKVRLDEIDGLWEDAKGNPAAPNFLDVKKGKERKQLLRQNRLSPDGKRVRHAPKVYARRFIAVPKAERRPGEEIRMPAGGQLRRPGRANRRDRQIFDKHGGAAAHLLRMPKAPWVSGTMEQELREKGQMISMPPGRKDPLMITWGEVSDSDVANRRFARWTHADPLGMRGERPHIGAASRGAEGSIAQEGPAPHQEGAPVRREPAGNVRERERNIRQRMGPRPRSRDVGPGREIPAEEQEAAKKINQEFADAAVNLFEKHGVSEEIKANHERLKAVNDSDIEGARVLGGGINAQNGVVIALKLNDGAEVIYKIVKNEQKAELVAETIDKIFNLNINANTAINRNISADALVEKLGLNPNGSSARALRDAIASGGGHIQEFCKPDCVNMGSHNNKTALYANEGFRNDMHKMMMNDWLTGNWDRHQGNWMVDSTGKAVQIDSGFGSDFAHYGDPARAASGRGKLMATTGGGATARNQHSGKKPGDLSSEDFKAEIEAVFEDHFSLEKFQNLKAEFGMEQANNLSTLEDFKQDFLDKAGKVWGLGFGQANPPEGRQDEGLAPNRSLFDEAGEDAEAPAEESINWNQTNPEPELEDDDAPEPVGASRGSGGRQSAPRQPGGLSRRERRVGQSAPRGQAVPAAPRSYRPEDAEDDYEPVEGFSGDPEQESSRRLRSDSRRLPEDDQDFDDLGVDLNDPRIR